jgi:hypothetical protein
MDLAEHSIHKTVPLDRTLSGPMRDERLIHMSLDQHNQLVAGE